MNAAPHCRYCGTMIRKRTRVVWVAPERQRDSYRSRDSEFSRYVFTDVPPSTKDDCQRLTNWQVTAVRRSADKATIISFHEWDGVSYVDKHFCGTSCAELLGRSAARDGHATRAYADALRKR